MDDVTYKHYVKKELWNEFVKTCHKNSLDFYSCGCLITAHLVMQDLMAHTYEDPWKEDKCTPQEAWESAMTQCGNGHSGMSAAMTACMIARYSPRGREFACWCNKNKIVDVNWKKKSRKL
jgi:hypothetical protein